MPLDIRYASVLYIRVDFCLLNNFFATCWYTTTTQYHWKNGRGLHATYPVMPQCIHWTNWPNPYTPAGRTSMCREELFDCYAHINCTFKTNPRVKQLLGRLCTAIFYCHLKPILTYVPVYLCLSTYIVAYNKQFVEFVIVHALLMHGSVSWRHYLMLYIFSLR